MALQVNGELVDDALIRQEAQAMRPRFEEEMQHLDPVAREVQLREWARENVIERTLLKQEAWKDPEPVAPEFIAEALKEVRETPGNDKGCLAITPDEQLARDIVERYRVERLIGRLGDKAPKPKAKDAVEFYKKNKEQFLTPELIRASHVVKNVHTEEEDPAAHEAIQQAEAELQAGADFASVADKYSDCAGSGGDLGYFPRGEMVEEFEEIVFPMKTGEVSPIFRSVFGYHIAKLVDRKPEGVRPLAEVQSQIEEMLMAQRREQALEEYLDALRAKASVETVKG